MPEVTQQAAEPGSTQVVPLTTWCILWGHLAHAGSRCLVGGQPLSPAAVQSAAAKPPLTSHFPAWCLGRGPGNHAQDPPAPSRWLALGGDSHAPCLRVFQMPFTELHQRPDSFPPHVICLCHQKMPTESYFAFPPSILCFL